VNKPKTKVYTVNHNTSCDNWCAKAD